VLPILAEGARMGLPATRLVNLADGIPLAFSGGGWQVDEDGSFRAVSFPLKLEAILMAELGFTDGHEG
jgi:hypothetical protein